MRDENDDDDEPEKMKCERDCCRRPKNDMKFDDTLIMNVCDERDGECSV